jgi:hypothetical protein
MPSKGFCSTPGMYDRHQKRIEGLYPKGPKRRKGPGKDPKMRTLPIRRKKGGKKKDSQIR